MKSSTIERLYRKVILVDNVSIFKLIKQTDDILNREINDELKNHIAKCFFGIAQQKRMQLVAKHVFLALVSIQCSIFVLEKYLIYATIT